MENRLKIPLIVLSFIVVISSFIFVPLLFTRFNPIIIQLDNCGYHVGENLLEVDECKWVPYKNYVIIPSLDSELCGVDGNLYAPEIRIEDGRYEMWYGAQSIDGHDSIHYATSDDGRTWLKYGTVIPSGANNHVNDPSVVKVNETYFMYYTVAPIREKDEIWCATSENGVNWDIFGSVLLPSDLIEEWDSYKVGRPSVLYENGLFKMWFDGSTQLLNDPENFDASAGRHVGYATSVDGFDWIKFPENPVLYNSGAVDVELFGNKYVIVEESREGIIWRMGSSEVDFDPVGQYLFTNQGTAFDKEGHVTPFILKQNEKWVATYTGAATNGWNHNRIDVWYPFLNVSLRLTEFDGLEATEFLPWATSSKSVEWQLDEEFLGKDMQLSVINSTILEKVIFQCSESTSTFTWWENSFLKIM